MKTYRITSFNPSAKLPDLGLSSQLGSYFTIAIFIAILLAIVCWFILSKTTLGYQLKASGFNRKKIIGMAGELDSARLKFALKNHLGTSVTDSKSCVIGMHNDNMICLVDENLSIDEYENIRSQTINGGAKIVKLMNTSAFYAPAAGVINICQALIDEDSKVLSCSVLDDNLIAFSRLVKISKYGVKEILELNLKPKDREILDKSIEEFIIYIKNININGANINFS